MTINNTLKSKVAVVIVPLPAQGHLNQLLHLSHLIAAYGIPVHYAGSASHNRQVKVRCNGWESESLTKIQFHDFELPPYDSPPPNVDLISFPHHLLPLFKASMHLRQPVSVLLQQLSGKFNRVIVIHDLVMAYVVQDVKLIPNGETYSFNPVSAFYNFLYSWISIPDKEKPFQLDSKDIPEGIPPEDDGFSTQDMTEFFLNQMKFLGFESGWIFNTSRIIEGRYVQLLERLPTTKSQRNYFALGPFNPVKIKSESMKNRHQCLNWLDKQGKDSVIYVSFGSTISLTDDQITELANGLERCGEKFIWVLRRADPNDIFTEADKVKKPQLHADYEERVKDRGIIVRDWAPQLEILAHPSVGGFMSHCGWNSCMESISMGVPVVAWPMHSDQPKNAFLVSNVLKIGVMVREWEHRGEIVKSITIENAVKTLMASQEGKEIKMRAANIGEAVRGSVAEGGASNLERDAFISHISR
ncbi:zeatin O-glucosyltransferase-like [Chenopodium quinoa]|uniref:zeatin O-glucosyltransferase-like n=1 Tax=Chenopodium quinoa TaxID=63459 RepID=UPI000B781113|nr:zeatin O-glucosyltransferase-like [Chenopodium quinoa]